MANPTRFTLADVMKRDRITSYWLQADGRTEYPPSLHRVAAHPIERHVVDVLKLDTYAKLHGKRWSIHTVRDGKIYMTTADNYARMNKPKGSLTRWHFTLPTIGYAIERELDAIAMWNSLPMHNQVQEYAERREVSRQEAEIQVDEIIAIERALMDFLGTEEYDTLMRVYLDTYEIAHGTPYDFA